MGADVRLISSVDASSAPETVVAELRDGRRGEETVPCWIPAGASLHPLGGLGYASAMGGQLAEQEGRIGLDLGGVGCLMLFLWLV